MNSTIRLAAAGILLMLAPMLANAIPIAGGSAYLDRDEPVSIFEIDATGYAGLSISFSALGGGSIDPCDGRVNADCLDVSAGNENIFSSLTATHDWQNYTAALPGAGTVFDLAFSAQISGGDENISVNWQIDAAEQLTRVPLEPRVLPVSEPGILLLLGFGFAGFVASRRRI